MLKMGWVTIEGPPYEALPYFLFEKTVSSHYTLYLLTCSSLSRQRPGFGWSGVGQG